MDTQRLIQRQQEFLRAAGRLQEAVSQQGGDILRDATIQRFEFTFEAAWKTLQLFLLHQGFEATGPRQTLKQAFAFGLIPTPEEADVWLAMLEDRNPTTHTYRETLAEAIALNIRAHYAARLVEMADRVAALNLD
ncbi:MAG: HI0074 family nucleotidyltransferase substrate-binding subunit [Thiobacillus sp.]